jgi:hypothetical protein
VPYTTNTAGLVSYEVGGQTLWFKPPAEEEGTTSFSDTQLNKGSIKAGTSIDDFSKLDSDVQNYFINWDWDKAEKSIKDDFENGLSLEIEKQAISSMDVPDLVKEKLVEYAENTFEDYREPTFDEMKVSLISVAQAYKDEGVKKSKAEKEMQSQIRQQIADEQGISSSKVEDIELTDKQKDLIRAALYEVYGGSWNWNDVNFEEVKEKYYGNE